MRPQRRQPTRLPHPWDSPGKNTGVCCHFLLQCMKVKSESEVTQSCPTLCDPRDGSPPGSPIPGILQARTLECISMSSSTERSRHWLHLSNNLEIRSQIQVSDSKSSPFSLHSVLLLIMMHFREEAPVCLAHKIPFLN